MKLAVDHRRDRVQTVNTAEMHNGDVIAAGLAVLPQLNIAIDAAARAMDDDDGPHS